MSDQRRELNAIDRAVKRILDSAEFAAAPAQQPDPTLGLMIAKYYALNSLSVLTSDQPKEERDPLVEELTNLRVKICEAQISSIEDFWLFVEIALHTFGGRNSVSEEAAHDLRNGKCYQDTLACQVLYWLGELRYLFPQTTP